MWSLCTWTSQIMLDWEVGWMECWTKVRLDAGLGGVVLPGADKTAG